MSTWEETYAIGAGGEVVIDQRSGGVQVRGWDGAEVWVKATADGDLGAGDLVSVEGRGGRLLIEAQSGGFSLFGLGRRQRVELELAVPFGTSCRIACGSGAVAVTDTRGILEVECGSGPVSADGIRSVQAEVGSGPVRLSGIDAGARVETGSGDVALERVRGNVRVEVGSGSVTARQIAGSLQIGTGSGRIAVEAVEGSAELESGSGSVSAAQVWGPRLSVETSGGGARLTGLDVTRLEVEAGSGGVEVELSVVRRGGIYEIETGSGGVEVTVPPNANLEIDLEAGAGRIGHRGLDLAVGHADRDEFRAVLNGGGARLRVEASSGPIRLRPGAPSAAVADVDEDEAVARVASMPPNEPVGIREVVAGDPALESSDQLRRVLKMVEEGRLSPREAEAILRALDG